MEMTTYAKYRILLFSLESTDGNFQCVDNLEDGCSAIETKAVFDEMRRTADVVDVGGSSPVARSGNRLVRMQRNPSRMPRDSLVRRRGGHWRGGRPSILSLNFHGALYIAVHGGAKFGGALPQPFVCLADRTRPMSHEFRVNVGDHCQHFGNCLALAIP